ncbi:MAG: hypothetical protein KKC23_05620 [Proteobacteria bacterium]|nr:hypothetical protein [Pseudomonadota bacterium]
MKTLSRSILVLACLLSLIGLSGCEQAEEAKKAITETVDQAQEKIKEVTGIAEEPKAEEPEAEEPKRRYGL